MPKPKWDRSLPNSIAIRKYLQQCGEYAQRLISTPGGHGLRHRLYSQAAYQLKYGGAPPVVYADPGAYPANADAVGIANIRETKQRVQLQETMDGVLEGAVEDGYPEEIRAMIEVDFSLDHLTLAEQFTDLLALLVMTAADIAWMKAEIMKPWVRDVKIEAFTSRQLQLHGFLTAIGQALPPLESIQAMWKAFNSSAQDKRDFAYVMVRFLERWPAIIDQTPANFAAVIVAFVNTLLHAEREANAAMMQANAAEQVLAPAAHPVALAAAGAAAAPVQQQHQQQPAGRGAHQGRGGRGGRGGGRGPAAPAPAGQPRPYCHTHGSPAPGDRGHHSLGCRNPGPNHQWYATFIDQQGGVAAV